ncbi:MAG: hypothetical protein JW709_01755 [Sedimentisphaerales bacterium]|nr:hypothetical protein [Sedimentisphaerales bacterium]
MAKNSDNKTTNTTASVLKENAPPGRHSLVLRLGCMLMVTTAALHSADKVVGGGDTWVAMACGRYTHGPWAAQQENRTVQMKVLDGVDLHLTQRDFMGEFSRPFNPESRKIGNVLRRFGWALQEAMGKTPDKTGHENIENVGWINQNWLTHAAFYAFKALGADNPIAENPFGESLIVLYKFLQAILTALFAYWTARELGAHPLIAALVVAFGVLLSRSFIDLRPNISSILYAIITVYLLVRWRNGKYRSMFWMIPVMILWANVHGGFIYAMMLFVLAGGAYAVHAFAGRWQVLFLLGGLACVTVIVMSATGTDKFDEILRGSQQTIKKIDNQKILLSQAFRTGKLSSMEYDNRIWRLDRDLKPMYQQDFAIRLTRIFAILAVLSMLGIIACVLWRLMRGNPSELFFPIQRRSLKYLAVGGGCVVLIPWFFSPFGLENLVHPLLVATGAEGKEWREVAEWLPIWQPHGFGNARYYAPFLILLGVTLVVWWVLRARAGGSVVPAMRRRPSDESSDTGPKVDLAHLAIVAITVAMSIQSRRFIFLGGIIVAPFLAVWFTDVVNMFSARRSKLPRENAVAMRSRFLVVFAWTTGMVFAAIFIACVWDTYFRPPIQGPQLSMFRRMVGISDQPVRAMEFFNANHLQGVVLNEWTHGGFITFHQTPDPKTGESPCKVFMDGRAQAAYDIEHFRLQNHYRTFPENMDMEEFHQKLQTKGLNLALLDMYSSSSDDLQTLFARSPRWVRLYSDQRYVIYADIEDQRNADIVKAFANDKLIWPEDILHRYNQGLLDIRSPSPDIVRRGLERLMGLETDEYLPIQYQAVWGAAKHLDELDSARIYCQRELKRRLDKLESGERFRGFEHARAVRELLEFLEKDARDQGQIHQSQLYQRQAADNQERLDYYRNEREGLFW